APRRAPSGERYDGCGSVSGRSIARTRDPTGEGMIARILVVLFALIVIGVGVAIGYFVLGDQSTPLGSRIAQLADPTAAVDPQDSTKVVVTVPQGATAGDIGQQL